MSTTLTNTRGWNLDRAMHNLRVNYERFPRHMQGDAAGYSYTDAYSQRSFLSIDPDGVQQNEFGVQVPIAREMVAFHELGHIVLGHTHFTATKIRQRIPVEKIQAEKEAQTPQFEVEAMMVANECARRLGVPGKEANYSAIDYYIRHFKALHRIDHGYRLMVDRVKINDAVEKILAAGLN
jgi:hypothetical protein